MRRSGREEIRPEAYGGLVSDSVIRHSTKARVDDVGAGAAADYAIANRPTAVTAIRNPSYRDGVEYRESSAARNSSRKIRIQD